MEPICLFIFVTTYDGPSFLSHCPSSAPLYHCLPPTFILIYASPYNLVSAPRYWSVFYHPISMYDIGQANFSSHCHHRDRANEVI